MRKSKLTKNLFANYIVVFLLVLYKYLTMWTNYENKTLNLMILGIGLFSIAILMVRKFSYDIIKKSCLCIILILITYYTSRSIDLVVSFLLALLFYKEEDGDKKFLKSFVISSIILFVLTLLLYFGGVLKSNDSQRIIDGLYVARKSLGFIHVNSIFMYFIPIILGGLYLIRKKASRRLFLIVVDIVSFIFYKITLSRTGFILIIIINIIIVFEKRIKNNKVCLLFFKNAYLFFTVLSIGISFKFGTDYSNSITQALSFRPNYAYNALTTYGIHLFGYGVNKNVLIDNGYLTILLSYGLIPFSIYYYYYKKTFNSLMKNGYTVIIIISCIYLLFENYIVFVNNFIFVIQFIYYLRASSNRGIHNNKMSTDQSYK